MKWNVTRLILAAVAMVMSLALVAGCGSLEGEEKSGGGGGTAKANTTTVVISDFKYRPQTLEVSKGTRVTWVNKDRDQHSVTADNGAFDKTLASGQSYSYTFNEAGTWSYHCRLFNNPGLKGKIVVK